ncbi:MAG: hypothetical protein IPM51_04795 [Sphingobacteriaceae bacterium]|nr:hypothetical protein [Sphingobacteriaceae bacterium]
MNNFGKSKIELFVFRAIDEPDLCQAYLAGHRKVLADYGIQNVTTNNTDWLYNPFIYCTLAKFTETDEYIGGVRIQIADGKIPLPVEAAVGYMDERIHQRVMEHAVQGGISESCGLWTAKSVKGFGIARYLMWASVSSANQLKFTKMLGICGWHTLQLFSEIGFVIDKSLGNNGDFLYPTKEHIANVIGILDAVSLKNSAKKDFDNMILLRNNLKQTITETHNNFNLVIQFNTRYTNITEGPNLTNTNYNLEEIKKICKK